MSWRSALVRAWTGPRESSEAKRSLAWGCGECAIFRRGEADPSPSGEDRPGVGRGAARGSRGNRNESRTKHVRIGARRRFLLRSRSRCGGRRRRTHEITNLARGSASMDDPGRQGLRAETGLAGARVVDCNPCVFCAMVSRIGRRGERRCDESATAVDSGFVPPRSRGGAADQPQISRVGAATVGDRSRGSRGIRPETGRRWGVVDAGRSGRSTGSAAGPARVRRSFSVRSANGAATNHVKLRCSPGVRSRCGGSRPVGSEMSKRGRSPWCRRAGRRQLRRIETIRTVGAAVPPPETAARSPGRSRGEMFTS